jgi:hypothetical protein
MLPDPFSAFFPYCVTPQKMRLNEAMEIPVDLRDMHRKVCDVLAQIDLLRCFFSGQHDGPNLLLVPSKLHNLFMPTVHVVEGVLAELINAASEGNLDLNSISFMGGVAECAHAAAIHYAHVVALQSAGHGQDDLTKIDAELWRNISAQITCLPHPPRGLEAMMRKEIGLAAEFRKRESEPSKPPLSPLATEVVSVVEGFNRDLTYRQKLVLQVLLTKKAIDERSKIRTEDVVAAAEPNGVGADLYKPVTADLARQGLIASKSGARGGIWLLPVGRLLATHAE